MAFNLNSFWPLSFMIVLQTLIFLLPDVEREKSLPSQNAIFLF